MTGRRKADHRAGRRLGQEQRAAQIDVHHGVEILRREVEQVATYDRAAPGVVDEAIEALETFQNRSDKRRVAVDLGYVMREERRARPRRLERRLRLLGGLVDDEVGRRYVESAQRERLAAGAADAAAGAGDEGERARRGCHAASSLAP